MSKWKVKRGNTAIQDIEIQDKDGVTVTNLNEATEIKFQVKESKTALYSKIEKTKGDGIEVDVPNTGWLRLTLLPEDTILVIKEYVMALQIKWTADEIWEIDLEINDEVTDVFEIVQDIIT